MRIPFLAGLLLISSASFADEDVANGVYGGLFAAGSSFPTFTFNSSRPQNLSTTVPVPGNNPFGSIYYLPGQLSSNFGGGGGANLGFRYNCFRLEGEFLYNVNSANEMSYAGTTGPSGLPPMIFDNSKTIANQNIATQSSELAYLSGQTNEYMGFINLFYDFLPAHPSEVSLYPYVGVGLGYQRIQTVTKYKAQNWTTANTDQWIVTGPPAADYPACPPNSACVTNGIASTGTIINASSYVGQGIVGLGYEMDSYFNFYLDFRYIATPQIAAYDRSFRLYTFTLGLNYSLSNT